MQTTPKKRGRPPTRHLHPLEQWRRRVRLTHKQMVTVAAAHGVDLTASHLGNLLSGRFLPSVTMALDLALVTGVPVETIVGWKKPLRRKQLAAHTKKAARNGVKAA